MSKHFFAASLLAVATLATVCQHAHAQRPRFSSIGSQPPLTPNVASGSAPMTSTTPLFPTNTQSGAAPGLLNPSGPAQVGTIPSQGWTAAGAPTTQFSGYAPQGPTLGNPGFDAFSSQPPAFGGAPTGNLGGYPTTGAPSQVYPPANSQPVFVPNQNYPGYPNYTGQPNSLYPGWQPSDIPWPQAPGGVQGNYLRLFQDVHFQHTWINGDDTNDVDINDVQLGVTANYPDFLRSGQPLQLTPVFIFHFWNGPSDPTSLADLPSKAYSTYLQLDWTTRQDVQYGGEVSFAIGVYSDFQSVTKDAIRLTGTGLGWVRVAPNLTLKAGVEYLDRLDLKLLPAGGIFWQPTDYLNLEIYFPRPRISRRLPQLGNTEVWAYVGAEYGGGSWVVERNLPGKPSDQVDINDIRVFGGIEWTTLKMFKGFFEVGYVFDRELVYRRATPSSLKLNDSFMLRGGFAF